MTHVLCFFPNTSSPHNLSAKVVKHSNALKRTLSPLSQFMSYLNSFAGLNNMLMLITERIKIQSCANDNYHALELGDWLDFVQTHDFSLR